MSIAGADKCPIHGTILNGFGTFTFCNTCDAEKEAQDNIVHEHQHGTGGGPTTCSGITGGTGNLSDLIDTDEYGWIIQGSQMSVGGVGYPILDVDTVVELKMPVYGSYMAAVYRVKLCDMTLMPHIKGQYRIVNQCSPKVEQLLYNRDGNIYLGNIPVMKWDPDF